MTMATTEARPQAAAQPAEPETRKRFFSMKWKLLAAFAGVFTLVFGFIAIWVVRYSTTAAQDRLVEQLAATATDGAQTVNGNQFQKMLDTVKPVPDPENPSGLGYPDSDLYRQQAKQLYRIHLISEESYPYTYFRNPDDGKLYFAASGGYYLDPQFGVMYGQPVADVLGPETYARMEKGLTQTTNEPAYTDDYGSWISSYAPVRDSQGNPVGAIGIDYRISYVDQVRQKVLREIIPVLVVTYLVLMGLVLLLSNALVRPLRRLTAATKRVADGEYSLDLRSLVKSRFPDEMYELGDSFTHMAEQVGAREKSLRTEVRRLRVEIDQSKREEAVKEIVETDFFNDLSARAAQMRARIRGNDDEA